MAPSQIVNPPALPQEIINLVVDEVARKYRNNHGCTQIESLKSLKACSLTSTSFHSKSRKHLFSSIEFLVNKSSQRRAARLVKVLEHKNSNNLLSAVRAVKLIVDVSWPEEEAIWNSKRPILRLLKNLGVSEDSVLRLLRLFCRAPLEFFAITARGGFLNWHKHSKSTSSVLRQICTLQSLQSLHFLNVLNIEQALIVNAFSSLRELGLRNATIKATSGTSIAAVDGSGKHTFGSLKTLEISYLICWTLFSLLYPSISPTSSGSFAPSVNLSGLRKLVATLSKRSLNILWYFMLGAAQSLEIIELQDDPWSGITIDENGPIDLSRITSLRTLTFRAYTLESSLNLMLRQRALANLIAFAKSPLGIQTVNVEFHVKSHLCNRNRDLNAWKTAPPELEWLALDAILTLPLFVDLRRLTINVNLFYENSGGQSPSEIEEGPIHIRTILPRIVASPSVKVTANFKSTISPETLSSVFHRTKG